ncbi:F-box protein CPR30-like [Pyrus ussuriensis x Pyrus communis]|uniref:F-box protein CPR30-like n=1 Tax=Pyrus ussuriensis x Pyrus communis TaxID=2448454 RepID=A0A5N5FUV1_9ROSA|nr:F-box protein CPR30-like [Pyrus ussuriensis x Pyrus communis]
MDCHLDDDRPGMILTLDLASEKYSEFPIPVHGDQDEIYVVPRPVRYLYICHHNFEVPGFQTDDWIMKEYGVTGSWRTLLCSVKKSGLPHMNFDSHVKPLVFSKNEQVEFCRKPDEFEVIVCEGGGARGAFVLFSMVIL